MRAFIQKIIRTPNTVVAIDSATDEQANVIAIGKEIKQHIGNLFDGSLAIRQVDAGSDNACEQELVALTNAFYDIERFGIHFVASPRHADMLLVTGPVARNMADALRSAYHATPSPKLVVALGDDAIDGGIFKDSYATYGGVSDVIPVDYGIPGDPPSPLAIMQALLTILQQLAAKRATEATNV